MPVSASMRRTPAAIALSEAIRKYPIYSFENAISSLAAPDGARIPCVPIPISGDTQENGVTAEAGLRYDDIAYTGGAFQLAPPLRQGADPG